MAYLYRFAKYWAQPNYANHMPNICSPHSDPATTDRVFASQPSGRKRRLQTRAPIFEHFFGLRAQPRSPPAVNALKRCKYAYWQPDGGWHQRPMHQGGAEIACFQCLGTRCAHSIPAMFPSASWAVPRSVLNSFTAMPNALAGSASKLVLPVGRPRLISRFCIYKSVK